MDSATITSHFAAMTPDALSNGDLTIILVSLLLLFAAGPFTRRISHDDDVVNRVSLMRILNCFIIAAVLVQAYFLKDNTWIEGIAQSLIIVYFGVLIYQIGSYIIRRRFGRKRQFQDDVLISDTYSSRGLSLILLITIGLIVLVGC